MTVVPKGPVAKYNLQLQVNNSVTISTYKRYKGESVSMYHASPLVDTPFSIKEGLKRGLVV